MLHQGFRFFSRSYHAGVLTKNIEVMSQFLKCPQFMEAKINYHIDFNNMRDVNSQVLDETLSVLFSESNAPKTIKALNAGDLILKKLLLADDHLRRLYLNDFSNPTANINWHEFELTHSKKGLESPFYRK